MLDKALIPGVNGINGENINSGHAVYEIQILMELFNNCSALSDKKHSGTCCECLIKLQILRIPSLFFFPTPHLVEDSRLLKIRETLVSLILAYTSWDIYNIIEKCRSREKKSCLFEQII